MKRKAFFKIYKKQINEHKKQKFVNRNFLVSFSKPWEFDMIKRFNKNKIALFTTYLPPLFFPLEIFT